MILTFLKHNWGWMILIIILMSTCNRYRLERNTAYLNADKLLDTVRYYKLKNGSVVASKAVLEYNDKQMKALVKSSNKTVQQIAKKFNKLETVVKTVTEIKVDTIKIVYNKPIEVDFKRSGELSTKDYNFTYESDKNGLKIANFKLAQDTTTFVIGDKRKWFLGEKIKTIDINHSNPLIKDIFIDASLLNEKVKWYESKWFYLGVGIVAGTLIIK